MQRLGVPTYAVDCLFSTLQNATHQVRTAYGDSDYTYGGSDWDIPMHGIGQGNGAGPAIWAAVSTPILNMLRSQGLGCHFISPFSNQITQFVGYSFVDDTDLIISKPSLQCAQQALFELQRSVDTWEGGLKATCGALVPEKTYWYLIEFKWNAGKWSYKSTAECPGSLFANDLYGNRKELLRIEPFQAQTTLGVDLAPDGNTIQQAKSMRAAAVKWADAMRTGKISPSDAWVALTSTIWSTLSYPLPSINLTKKQCEYIMAPIFNYALPALGICITSLDL